MGYSQEFIDWTKAEGLTASHTILEESTKLAPDTSNEVSCEGIGYVGMMKNSDGQLFVKMPADNADGFELVSYFTILVRYVPGDLTPRL